MFGQPTHYASPPVHIPKKKKIASQYKVVFLAANVPQLVLRETENRLGLMICNPQNSTTTYPNAVVSQMFQAPETSVAIPYLPNEKRVMDFVCPTDALYMVSDTAGAIALVEETLEIIT